MSKNCLIDNEKLGMMTNSFKTKDGNVLCVKHAEVLGLTLKDVSELSKLSKLFSNFLPILIPT